MTKGMDKMIAAMRQQHEELTVAIRVFDRMNGSNGKALKNVRQAAQAVNGEPIQVAADGFREMTRVEAVKLTLKTAKRPMRAVEVAEVLQSSGRKDDRKAVQQTLGQMAKQPEHHIKKAGKGYGKGYAYTGA